MGITNSTGTGQFKTCTGVPESLESCSVSCAWATPGQTRCKERASPQRAPWNTTLSSECSPSEHLLVLPREIWVTLHQNKAVVYVEEPQIFITFPLQQCLHKVAKVEAVRKCWSAKAFTCRRCSEAGTSLQEGLGHLKSWVRKLQERIFCLAELCFQQRFHQ